MDNSKQKLDIYYNPWTDDFDQNNQQSVSDTLPIEENLPTEDPWEMFEETVIDSGQALGYNPDDGLSDKWELDSDEKPFPSY